MVYSYEIATHQLTIKKNMMYSGNTVLTFKIEFPQFTASMFQPTLIKINQYYKMMATKLQTTFETTMYQEAINDYKNAQANNYPFNKHEAILTYEITYNQNCAISLYFDQYQFTGGAHGGTIRTSDTWDLDNGDKYTLAELFPHNSNYQEYIIKNINEQIAKQIANGDNYYFDNYQQLVKENFNQNSFYVSTDGIMVYFQQYAIGPYSSGIIQFLIPFSKNDPIPPTCFDNNFHYDK